MGKIELSGKAIVLSAVQPKKSRGKATSSDSSFREKDGEAKKDGENE